MFSFEGHCILFSKAVKWWKDLSDPVRLVSFSLQEWVCFCVELSFRFGPNLRSWFFLLRYSFPGVSNESSRHLHSVLPDSWPLCRFAAQQHAMFARPCAFLASVCAAHFSATDPQSVPKQISGTHLSGKPFLLWWPTPQIPAFSVVWSLHLCLVGSERARFRVGSKSAVAGKFS